MAPRLIPAVVALNLNQFLILAGLGKGCLNDAWIFDARTNELNEVRQRKKKVKDGSTNKVKFAAYGNQTRCVATGKAISMVRDNYENVLLVEWKSGDSRVTKLKDYSVMR